MAVGRLTDGGWWATNGGWWVTDGGWWATDGGWWVTDGGWWVATKHQRVDAIVKKKKGERPYGTPWAQHSKRTLTAPHSKTRCTKGILSLDRYPNCVPQGAPQAPQDQRPLLPGRHGEVLNARGRGRGADLWEALR